MDSKVGFNATFRLDIFTHTTIMMKGKNLLEGKYNKTTIFLVQPEERV